MSHNMKCKTLPSTTLALTLSVFLLFEYNANSVLGVTILVAFTFVLFFFAVMFIDWLVYYIEEDYWAY